MKKLPRLTHKTHGVCRIARAALSESGEPVFHVIAPDGEKRVLLADPQYWADDPAPVFQALRKSLPAHALVDIELCRKLTCKKCGRLFEKPWSSFRLNQASLCESCKPKKVEKMPVEGETFAGLRRVINRGKASSYFVRTPRKEGTGRVDREIYFERAEAMNQESAVREWLFVREQVYDATEQLKRETVRSIQQKWGIAMPVGTVARAREEIARQSDADAVDQELARTLQYLAARFLPRKATQRLARKCKHGNWMAKNDRRGYSRQCSGCRTDMPLARPKKKHSRRKVAPVSAWDRVAEFFNDLEQQGAEALYENEGDPNPALFANLDNC
jgi:hypothetical protein